MKAFYITLLVIGFCLYCTAISFRMNETCVEKKCIDTVIVFEYVPIYPDSTLSLENVQQELLKHGIKHPEIVYRQVCWETGWLSSKNCLVRNNLTGMKGGEVTNDNPEGYKIYNTWQHSIRGYARWQRRWYGDSTEDYYSFLRRIRYAKNPELYEKHLKSLNTNWNGN